MWVDGRIIFSMGPGNIQMKIRKLKKASGKMGKIYPGNDFKVLSLCEQC